MRELVPEALSGERVDRVVAMLTGLPRATVADLVELGAVRLDGRVLTTRSIKVRAGSSVEVEVPSPTDVAAVPAPEVELEVVYADDDVVVIDKPSGLVVHPGAGNDHGTLAQALLARYPEIAGVGQNGRPGVVHRLDKGTSGLLVVARCPAAYSGLVAQLAARVVDRRYVALVWGRLEPAKGVIDAPIGRSRRDPTRMVVSSRGREARTIYEVRRRFDDPVEASLSACRLHSGRTHQIRVHLAAIGHPVVGDPRYGGHHDRPGSSRPFLHAERLSFDHPATGQRLTFESQLPEELEAVLAQLS
ncbi:MAG: RluA family pseudouridine synthase [Acidimicrobiales bacterium]